MWNALTILQNNPNRSINSRRTMPIAAILPSSTSTSGTLLSIYVRASIADETYADSSNAVAELRYRIVLHR